MLLYALFFLTVRLLRLQLWHVLLLAVLGFWLQSYSELIGRGLFAFYMGASCFVFRMLVAHEEFCREVVVVANGTLLIGMAGHGL